MKNLNAYCKLKPIYAEYAQKNPLTKNAFYNKHKQEIDLCQRVMNELKQYKNKSDKLPSVKQLETEKEKLQADITNLSEQFKAIKSERAELEALKRNVDMFLKRTPELQQEAPKKENHNKSRVFCLFNLARTVHPATWKSHPKPLYSRSIVSKYDTDMIAKGIKNISKYGVASEGRMLK